MVRTKILHPIFPVAEQTSLLDFDVSLLPEITIQGFEAGTDERVKRSPSRMFALTERVGRWGLVKIFGGVALIWRRFRRELLTGWVRNDIGSENLFERH